MSATWRGGTARRLPIPCDGFDSRLKPITCDVYTGWHIYVMYLTPAEPTFLFYSIVLTNPIVENMSQAKPRRESNPKLVQRFPLHCAPSHCTIEQSLQSSIKRRLSTYALSEKSKVLLVLGALHKNATGWLPTRRAQAHFAVSLNYC